jgi:excisionase family DNA binding protein
MTQIRRELPSQHLDRERTSRYSTEFENLITKKELVTALGISSSFISKLMASGELPYFKIGRAVRFRISEISEWLEKYRVPH